MSEHSGGKMSKFYFIIIFAGTLITSDAYAQLGGLLKDLKSAADKIQQQSNPTTNNSTTSSSPDASQSNSTTSLDADQYCKKLKSLPYVITYSDNIYKLMQVFNDQTKRKYHPAIYAGFESDNLDLAKDLNKKLPERLRSDSNFYDRYIGYFADCAASLKGDNLVYFILPGVDNLDTYFNLTTTKDRSDFIVKQFNHPSNTFRGSLGLVEKLPLNVAKEELSRNFGYYWITLFSIAGRGNEAATAKTADVSIKKIESISVAQQKSNEESRILAEESKKKNELQRIQDAKNKEEYDATVRRRIEKESNFAKTPDGQLTIAYQNFQIIQLCYDLRKDYAVKYIGITDYNEYRSKIKRIEQDLEKKTQEKNTNKLYALAEQRNRSFDPTDGLSDIKMDVIETITNNAKGANWLASKNDCDLFSARFRDISDSILGRDALKKSF
jgi:hypothetical protein